ncbi:G-protein coupled receptor Mth2-like [Maniola hyperantus]|uniref:G-protein coupled receptor Mth2-like n=1 Tax=Aphantopus hyperantus TaxID=2795564 RepID=UPI00156801FA|nr:G-protein coupled receptor Mth2-like [Maniola hyperantus]
MMCSKIFLVLFIIVLVSRTICAFSMILGPGDNITAKCLERKCIPKCCEIGKYLNASLNECFDYGQDFDFQDVPVYDAFTSNTLVLNQLKNATMGDIFYLVPGKMYEVMAENNLTFAENYPFRAEPVLISYLTETGELYMEFPNAYNRWTRVEDFCVDYAITDERVVEVHNLIVLASTEEVGVQSYYYYYLITSCVFLVLVLLVYMILPELRNLGGMILMAYTSSLLMAFILLAIMQGGEIVKCMELTASIYFFLLATFCWMSVMSVDIWWTFRGYAKSRPIHRRGECFCNYDIPCNSPLILEGQKLVYLYIPLLFLILTNWLFFLMTAYNIRRLMRGTAVLKSAASGNPAAHQQQRNRLMVYLKLSVIMGINWLLEVVSFFSPELKIWEFSDTYNLLIGFAIFLIFVCKKKIYKKLVARFYELRSRWFGGKRPTRTLTKSSTSSSTLESNLSQDIPLQVSNNPMPEDKRGRKNCNVFSFNRTNYKINTDLK